MIAIELPPIFSLSEIVRIIVGGGGGHAAGRIGQAALRVASSHARRAVSAAMRAVRLVSASRIDGASGSRLGTSRSAASNEAVTIEASGSAPRVAPNRSTVPLPNPGETEMAYGIRSHQELPRIVGETNPGAGGTFNVRPGITGPDLENPTGMNATFAEMKSLWGRQRDMVSQVRDWGLQNC